MLSCGYAAPQLRYGVASLSCGYAAPQLRYGVASLSMAMAGYAMPCILWLCRSHAP